MTSGMQKSRDTRTEADKLNVEDKAAAQKRKKKRKGDATASLISGVVCVICRYMAYYQ